jgi:Secretion system C-terminal sorting domain
MKKIYFFLFLLASAKSFGATKFWKGTAGDGLWATATNWVGDAVPAAADDVVLDNSALPVSYIVTLPVTAVTVSSLTITPSGLNIISLILPAANTNSPGFQTTGSIFINNGGLFKNSSDAASAPTITIGATTADSMYIYNGGTYEHNSQRSSTLILDKISAAPGTEYGLVHFNIPQSGSAGIPLQGRIFGSLEFSAGNAPSALTYTSTGTTVATPVVIRGDFKINSPAAFSSTLLSGFSFAGNFTNIGNFNYAPQASGSAGTRSLYFNGSGSTQVISGTGNFTIGAEFRKMEISSGAVVSLQRNITTFSAGDSIIVQPNAALLLPNEINVSGTGSIFLNDTLSTLKIGSANGITSAGATGNVQTDTRIFSKKAYYFYNGIVAQASGSGLPDSVYKLYIQNSGNVTLSSQLCVVQQLALEYGLLFTTIPNRIKLAKSGITTSLGINNYGSTNQGNATSFISGPMIIETNSTDTITFPIGKKNGADLVYAPVKLKPSNTTLKDYRAEYFPAEHIDVANVESPPLDHVSRVEYWDISCNLTIPPDNEAKVSLSWRPNSAVGTGNPVDSLTAMQDLTVAHYFNDGFSTRWRMDGTTPTFTVRPNSNLSYGYITTDLFTGTFSPFTLGTRSPFNILPLKLLDFSATAGEESIKLQWIAAEEQGIDRYELQKSTDGRNFSTISSIPSLNRLSTFAYHSLDGKPAAGWNYYRLKVFDNQQNSYYTAAVKVWMGKAGQVMIYPNPASKLLKIVLPPRSNSNIRIVNSAGQVLKRVSTTEGLLTVDIESLDKGMYLVYIQTNRQAIVQRFVKQ